MDIYAEINGNGFLINTEESLEVERLEGISQSEFVELAVRHSMEGNINTANLIKESAKNPRTYLLIDLNERPEDLLEIERLYKSLVTKVLDQILLTQNLLDLDLSNEAACLERGNKIKAKRQTVNSVADSVLIILDNCINFSDDYQKLDFIKIGIELFNGDDGELFILPTFELIHDYQDDPDALADMEADIFGGLDFDDEN
ncbi:MAG: hypothetical protein Q9M91_05050 [Candidatus Dojkabacteria bacterium]|nr:hypothetical protein [Candidatus Dojkabacteria bacterium]MDQ7021174.1 hypothetical protein [Candidatus Dojkabacteria bacterium]